MTRSCREIRADLADWLDDMLSDEEHTHVEDHLANCQDCRDHFARFESQSNDFLMLAAAANRIAAGGMRAPQKARRGFPVLRLAAAVVIAATIGLSTLRHLDRDSSVTFVSKQHAPPTPERPRATSEFQLTLAGSRTAVRLKSDDPQIHIIWLYEDPSTEGATNHEEPENLES